MRLNGESLRLWLRQFWPYLAAAFVIVYFLYHLVNGPHGLLAWQRLESELSEAQQDLKQIKAQETGLERRVNLLKKEIDPDLLREQAGVRLNLHHPDDRILLAPTPQKE
jgi:cell division protein FtsB